jgi:tmRNA-binding protein
MEQSFACKVLSIKYLEFFCLFLPDTFLSNMHTSNILSTSRERSEVHTSSRERKFLIGMRKINFETQKRVREAMVFVALNSMVWKKKLLT